MLIQLLFQHPEALATVVRNTPTWVWGLATGLLALGLSQVRDRSASLVRMSITPAAMTAFSLWGTVSAFGSSPYATQAVGVWALAAGVVFAPVASLRLRGARYDAGTRTYFLPGSFVPLALIAGIFLVKYVVGVDLAMAPQLLRDAPYTLTVAALYGAFTGMFVGRAARLWKLALRPAAVPAT